MLGDHSRREYRPTMAENMHINNCGRYMSMVGGDTCSRHIPSSYPDRLLRDGPPLGEALSLPRCWV